MVRVSADLSCAIKGAAQVSRRYRIEPVLGQINCSRGILEGKWGAHNRARNATGLDAANSSSRTPLLASLSRRCCFGTGG